jgi:tetratricopeptide (TPR) repeat protein
MVRPALVFALIAGPLLAQDGDVVTEAELEPYYRARRQQAEDGLGAEEVLRYWAQAREAATGDRERGKLAFVQATVFLRLGRVYDAERACAAALEASPKFPAAQHIDAHQAPSGKDNERAGRSIDAALALAPDDARLYLAKASLLLQEERVKDVVALLEGACARAAIDDDARYRMLDMLRVIHRVTGNVDALRDVLGRMHGNWAAPPAARERIADDLADIDRMGATALLAWAVEKELAVVDDDDAAVEDRRRALRRLLDLSLEDVMLRNEHTKELAARIFKASVRMMVDAPPELLVVMMQFLHSLN